MPLIWNLGADCALAAMSGGAHSTRRNEGNLLCQDGREKAARVMEK